MPFPLLGKKTDNTDTQTANAIIDKLVFDEAAFDSDTKLDEHKAKLKSTYAAALGGDTDKLTGFKRLLSQIPPVQNIDIAISIEGLHDVYERGEFEDDAYALHKNYQPSTITAKDGIVIQAISNPQAGTVSAQPASDSNILLIGGTYQAGDAGITIQSAGSTILQAGQDSIYDRETNTFKKKSWGGAKKKITVTTTTEQIADSEAVKLNANAISVQANDNLYAYATEFNAPAGQIQLKAGEALGLYAVQEVDVKEVESKTTSSFAGIKYRKVNTKDSKQIISELPTSLIANYSQSESGGNTQLQGTRFANLQGASVTAGVGDKAVADARIILDTISTTVSVSQSRQFENLVWQSISESGYINEDAKLPSFIGVTPTLNATGGLAVQVPINKDDLADKDHLVNVLTRLSHNPGFDYLSDIIQRDDVDFTAIRLAQEEWDYKQEGLSPAGAALLAIALSMATAGGGVSVLSSMGVSVTAGSATAAMANAAFTSLVTQAGTTLVNNKGDVNKTLKDLGKSQTAKNMARAVLTAGATASLDKFLAQTLQVDTSTTATIGDKFTRAFVQGAGHALTDSLIYGESLEESLKRHLTNQLVDAAAAGIYTHGVKPLDFNDTEFITNVAHKLAAGLTGCLSAKAKDESCESAAIGAIIGEMVGDWMIDDDIQAKINSGDISPGTPDYNKILNTAKLAAGSFALLYDFDVDTAANEAGVAVENNSIVGLAPGEIGELVREFEKAKSSVDIRPQERNLLELMQDAYSKGNIELTQRYLDNLDNSLATWANQATDTEMQKVRKSVAAVVYAINMMVVPTHVVEIIPVGKITKVNRILPKTSSKVGDIEVGKPTSQVKMIDYSLISTGRTTPRNLTEQLAMEEVRGNPKGRKLPIKMSDAKNGLYAKDGWVKKAQNVNGVEIHYVENVNTGLKIDFKFKD
ncbi:DUF637 domain-containing protein [Moraxella nasovis]|uniref:DUF637 domain-containing protein n=1 Tax=Moraxella nasovis TaxID=2904121 RepID=UPI001F60FE68|nr:DUF637 domain-containing protein [Moraxella nasovis]UNU72752.1 DUF637 domain-containing protein [Moraxella nasovis]